MRTPPPLRTPLEEPRTPCIPLEPPYKTAVVGLGKAPPQQGISTSTRKPRLPYLRFFSSDVHPQKVAHVLQLGYSIQRVAYLPPRGHVVEPTHPAGQQCAFGDFPKRVHGKSCSCLSQA